MACGSWPIVFSCLTILMILSLYLAWPWLYAAYIWRQATIKYLNTSTILLLNNQKSLVPRIIHQTYRNRISIPFQWQQASNSCRNLHSDYEYKFWSNDEGRGLIEKELPHLLHTFDSYPYDIQRADVIRLVVLYIYGGIYLDFDIVCLRSLDPLLNYQFILPQTAPVGLSNDVIVSTTKHPFLSHVLNNLPNSNRNSFTKYPTVMFSTGPMFLTYAASSYPKRSSLDVLSSELYGKYVYNSSHSLFRHLKSSTWHGKDAAMIKWIYCWRNVFLSTLIIFLIMTFSVIHFIQQYKNMINKMYVSYVTNWKSKPQIKLVERYCEIV